MNSHIKKNRWAYVTCTLALFVTMIWVVLLFGTENAVLIWLAISAGILFLVLVATMLARIKEPENEQITINFEP